MCGRVSMQSLRKTAVDLSEFQAANMSANRFKNKLLNALPCTLAHAHK